jgi:hypothetical protein
MVIARTGGPLEVLVGGDSAGGVQEVPGILVRII